MRIMIADDHSLYVEGLVNLLGTDFEIVSTVSTGATAIEQARLTKPDVVLMDVNMPTIDGITATKAILAENPGIKILMLTSFGETDTLFRAIRAGAVGYILKNLEATDIVADLYELEKGRNPFSPGLGNQILKEFRTQQAYSKSEVGRELLIARHI